MISQSAEVVWPCQVCGTLVPYGVAERLVQGRLQWTISLQCPNCGNATEEVGWDEPPEAVRQALVDAHGWARIVLHAPAKTAVVMKVLRQGWQDLSPGEAMTHARRLLEGGVCGTRVEMELLAERLRDAGVVANVQAD